MTVMNLARGARLLLLALLVAASAGCATLPPDATPAQKADPFEAWNRKVFDFNDDLDKAILKPIATLYADIFPPVVRRGVDNFYANLLDPWSAVNSLLQGKPFIALQSAFRFGRSTASTAPTRTRTRPRRATRRSPSTKPSCAT